MVGDAALHRPQGLSASPGHDDTSSVWPAVFLLLLIRTAASSFQEVALSATAKASSDGEEGHGDGCPTAFLGIEASPVLCSGTLNHRGS